MTALKLIHVFDWGPGTIILIHGGKYEKKYKGQYQERQIHELVTWYCVW